MFDFLAHWFAKTEIIHNEKDEPKEIKKSFYKNGHFSLDLTFLTLVVVFVIVMYLYRRYKNKQFLKFKSKLNSFDIEMQPQRSELNVERAPLNRQSTTKFSGSSDRNQNKQTLQ